MITLEELVVAARRTAARQREQLSESALERRLDQRGLFGRPPGRFRAALRGGPISVIAEVKGASPVAGTLRENLAPTELAASYERAGATAISVLTEETRFAGSLEHLRQVTRSVELPTLRKDFVSERYQVLQAAEAGASAVLLIADVLGADELASLTASAHEVGLDALVEVHGERSLGSAGDSGSGLIGVNNRNLATMSVDPDHALELVDRLPEGWVKVAESGVSSRQQVLAAEGAGYDAVLVGTSLVTSADPGSSLRALLGEDD